MTPPKGAPDFPEAEQGALLTAFCISLICHLLPARHELKGQRRVLPRSSLSLPCLHSRHSINMCLKSLLEKWKLNQTACWKNSSLSQQILWQNITIFSGFAAQHGAFRNHSRNFPFLTSSPVSRLSHFHHLLPGRECLQSLSATFWQHLRTALCRSPRPWEVQVHVPCKPPPPTGAQVSFFNHFGSAHWKHIDYRVLRQELQLQLWERECGSCPQGFQSLV